uniref:Uncharacterized protein n=1 Tax=Octopus bimaculoides TaxID=37653 RepID=A0A0L8GVV1_OCTBM
MLARKETYAIFFHCLKNKIIFLLVHLYTVASKLHYLELTTTLKVGDWIYRREILVRCSALTDYSSSTGTDLDIF